MLRKRPESKWHQRLYILNSGIYVGQGINVVPAKFGNKIKHAQGLELVLTYILNKK